MCYMLTGEGGWYREVGVDGRIGKRVGASFQVAGTEVDTVRD